jgi:hypothetical protein
VSSRYVAGGYLLAKPGRTLPAGVLTASACLADMAPDSWAIEWVKAREGEREDHAERLGIQREDLPAVARWATDRFAEGRLLWPNIFPSADLACEFRRRFVRSEIHLLGIALPADLVDAFLFLAAPRNSSRAIHPWVPPAYTKS